MNNFELWRAVDPSPTEIQAVAAAFTGLDVMNILPRLVMVCRAVAAGFYSDDLHDGAGSRPNFVPAATRVTVPDSTQPVDRY